MTITDFHQGFDTPFSDRTTTGQTTEGAYPFPVAIDGRGYIIDLTKYQRRTLNQLRAQSDTSQEPGEQSLEIEGVWKRTGTAAIRGAGQRFYDDTDSDRHRYWKSRGIDPWKRRELRLLHGTERVRVSTASGSLLLTVGDYLVVSDDATVLASTTPRAGGFVDQDIFSGAAGQPVLSMASNGIAVFCACGSGGVRQFTPGTPGGTALGSLTPGLVVYANGWLVVADGPLVSSLSASGVATTVGPHQNAGFVWNTGTSAPNAIYLGGNAGDRAQIHRIGIDQTGGALTAPIFAGDLPAGETIHVLSYYSGTMLIGTSRGLRAATIAADGGLSIGPVIEDLSGEGVRCFEARGQYAWYGHVNDYDADHRGLARADLSRYTEDGVPAYAPDLASTVTSGAVSGVASWREGTTDYRLFTVDGSGLWTEHDDLVTDGAIDIGYLGQASPELKQLQSVSVSTDALEGTVTMLVTNEEGQQVDASAEVQASYQSGEMQRSVAGELLDLTLVLNRSTLDTTAGPVVKRWTVRVIPAPPAVEEIIIPILMGNEVRDAATDVVHYYNPYAEFFRLKQLESARTVVTYREGQVSYDVTIREVNLEGATILGPAPRKWAKDRTFFDGIIGVRMITLDGVPPRVAGAG